MFFNRRETEKLKNLFNIVRLFTSKPVTIARENLTIDRESQPTSEGQQEWRKFVGSIRRKVQRHASTSNAPETASAQPKNESLTRKNSLTQNLPSKKDEKNLLIKQKSIGNETKTDIFKTLTFRDKLKGVSVKNIDSLAAPKGVEGLKGVRKSDKTKDSDRSFKCSFSKNKNNSFKRKKDEEKGRKQDDFLKATMRIFLVVSPPVGKLQVIFYLNFII